MTRLPKSRDRTREEQAYLDRKRQEQLEKLARGEWVHPERWYLEDRLAWPPGTAAPSGLYARPAPPSGARDRPARPSANRASAASAAAASRGKVPDARPKSTVHVQFMAFNQG